MNLHHQEIMGWCDWVHKKSVWAETTAQLEPYNSGLLYRSTVAELCLLFEREELCVWCAGMAQFLKKVCEEKGYEACTYNYGTPDTRTHMVTIVGVPTGGRVVATVYDATFNCCMGSLHNLLDNVIAGRFEKVEIEHKLFKPSTVPESHRYYWRDNGPKIRSGLSKLLGKPVAECHTLELMLFPECNTVFSPNALGAAVMNKSAEVEKERLARFGV